MKNRLLLWLLLIFATLSHAEEGAEKIRLATQIVAGVPQLTATAHMAVDPELSKKMHGIHEEIIGTLTRTFVNQFPKLTSLEVAETIRKYLASSISQLMQPMLISFQDSMNRKIAAYAESFSIDELKEILRKPTLLNEKHESFLIRVIEPNQALEKMAINALVTRYTSSLEFIRRDLVTQSSEKPNQ